MSSHHKESRIEDYHTVFSNPGSPAASPKPGSPAWSSTRPRHSSGGGTASSNNTSSAGGYAGGYATRHSLTQLSAASALGAAAACDSPASRGSSGGRSMQASRRASVTEHPSQQQPQQHHRTASHGVVDLSAHSLTSPSEKPEKARGFYRKMMSYGRRAPGPAATAVGQPHQQLSQQLARESSVPELVLVGGDHPSPTESIAEQLPESFQLGPPSPAGVAAALLGDAAAAAAVVGMQTSLDSDAAAAAAELVAALTSSLAETNAPDTATAIAENHIHAALDGFTALHAAAGGSSQSDQCELLSPGGESFKDRSLAVRVPFPSVSTTGSEGEGSSSKVDSKPSTPTERAKALARAALDVLQPHLRKSRKAAEDLQVEEHVNNAGSSKRQRKKAAVLAAKEAEAEAATAAAAAATMQHDPAGSSRADAAVPTEVAVQESVLEAGPESTAVLAGSPWVLAASKGAASAAAPEDPTLVSTTGRLAGAAASSIEAGQAAAMISSGLSATVDHTVPAVCEEAVMTAAAKESPRQPKSRVITPQSCSWQGAASPGRSPQLTPRTPRSEKQMQSGVAESLVEPAAAAFSVGGDMQDTERAVSLKLGELGDYFRTPAAEDTAGTGPTAAAAGDEAATPSEAGDNKGAAIVVAEAPAAEQDACVAAVPDLLSDASSSTVNTSTGIGGRNVTISAGGVGSVTSSTGGAAGSVTGSGDYRYSELIFRLLQFLPALKSADAANSNSFEATWELIKVCVADVQQLLDKQPQQWQQQLDKYLEQVQNASEMGNSLGDDVLLACMSELTALVNTAKLAQLQTVKLEALDAEVAQLQKLLVRVGQDIKAGAQQQQLRDLFHTFPSFARQVMEQSTGSSSSSNISEPASPAPAAPAAAVSVSAPGPKPLAQTLALALVNHSKYPHSSGDGSHWCNGLDTVGSTWSQGWSITSCGGSDRTLGDSSGGGSANSTAGAAAGQCSSPVRGLLLSGTVPAPRSSAGRVPAGAFPGVSEGGVRREQSTASPPPPPPPHKELTAEDTEKLASLYKVAGDKPQRIFYKELKLAHHKISGGGHSRYSDPGSPGTSPRCHAAATSPAATAGGSAAAASWRRVVSPEPPAAIPAAATDDAKEQQEDESADNHAVWSSSKTAYHPLYATGSIGTLTINAIPCSTGHAYIGSGAPSSNARGSWSGVPKGFRILRAIPEAHKKPQVGNSQGGLGSPQTFRDGSPSQSRSHSTPPGMLASPDSPMYQRGQPGRSPDRFAAGRQARRVGSPLRHSLAQTQFHEQHHPQQQPQQLDELQLPLGWSYPRGRDSRLRASYESSLSLGPAAANASALPLPDSYTRARSTSPSIGMHYLERPSSGADLKSRGAAASVRTSYCSSIVTSGSAAGAGYRGSGPLGIVASSVPGSPTKVAAAPVVAEDYRFSEARRVFTNQHSSAVAAEGLSPTKACGNDNMGGAKLAARLSPIKDADSKQIDAAMKRLGATLQDHNVNLELIRLGPCLYSAAGRKLRIRMLYGNLLVRTGGGHESLLDALGKLPLAAIDSSSTSSTNSSNASASGNRGSSSHQEDSADDSCYANLAVEAAVAAAMAAADNGGNSCSNSVEQQPAAVLQAGVVTSADDAVAVVRVGEGSGLAAQCIATEGVAGLCNAAWAAVVQGAAEAGQKGTSGMQYNTQQPALPAAAQ